MKKMVFACIIILCMSSSVVFSYTQDDVTGTWHLTGKCSSSTDIGTYVFNNDGTFNAKMTDEELTTWDETGTYNVHSNVVTLIFPDDTSLSLTFENPERMSGYNFDCNDVFHKVSALEESGSTSTLSHALDIYISELKYNDMFIEANFEFVGEETNLIWKLNDFSIKN